MSQIKIVDNGHNWYLLTIIDADGSEHSFGFGSLGAAEQAVTFARYCQENLVTITSITKE